MPFSYKVIQNTLLESQRAPDAQTVQSFQTAQSGDPSPGAPQLRGRREVQSPVALPGPGPPGSVPRTGADGRGGTEAVPARAPARRGAARAPRFPQTPTWRRPPPPAPTPPRATASPGPRGQAPAKFRFSLPSPPPPSAPRPPRHLPGPTRAAAPRVRVLLVVADSGHGLCLLPGPSLAGCVGPREAGAIRTRRAQPLAGDFTAPPVEPDNGRPGWLPSCARTGAPPPKRQTRARAHPPCPFFPVPSPRPSPCPSPPSPRDRTRGGAFRGGHTHWGASPGGVVGRVSVQRWCSPEPAEAILGRLT
ncbi:basic proline-rich protein-like [Grammomys surdaster]|uniref:basic proline-rich protein-like n=1 Tax=Grammomys surdaster TaxID=491861 RepID=UPI0010A05B45|nr:basic proline-rich protein-like [Grammomys surdaster]